MRIIGILNVTPDSCSDAGLYLDPDKAVVHAQNMMKAGAYGIDIGGESTRPGAQAISPEQEQSRVLPIIQKLKAAGIHSLGIDTRNASTAIACLKLGISWLNDVSALSHDPEMKRVARDFDRVVLMHMRGLPENMQLNLQYTDLIKEIKNYLAQQIQNSDLDTQQILVDPGLGFGKSTAQCLEILKHLHEFTELAPVYIGPSRKNFIGDITQISHYGPERDFGTVGAILRAFDKGASYARVHHVQASVEALKVYRILC